MFTLIFIFAVASNPIQQYGVDSGYDFNSENGCLNFAESLTGQKELIKEGANSFDCVPNVEK